MLLNCRADVAYWFRFVNKPPSSVVANFDVRARRHFWIGVYKSDSFELNTPRTMF
jgi:hypothetical protein